MLTKWEELKLIARCVANDDRHAFGMLVEAYQDQLRRFLYNLTLGDAALCDDLAQETFLKAYIAIRSFKGLSRFKTWLFRIAYNEYYAYTRSHQDVSFCNIYPPDTPSGISERSSDAKMDVEECLRHLTEIERTVVLLFYMEDQPIKKIVEMTGLPEGTVKSHLHRAKAKMSKLLKT